MFHNDLSAGFKVAQTAANTRNNVVGIVIDIKSRTQRFRSR